jgi:hypothetical protein
MTYTWEWLVQMCATSGGRTEVLRLLSERDEQLDEIGKALMGANFCHHYDCDKGRPLDHYELPYAVGRLVEMWKERGRCIDGICAAYDTGVEPDPEHFPFAAKVAELRHEVNDLRYEIAELRAHEAAEVKSWQAAHAAMQRMKTKLDVARNELLNIVQVVGVSDERRDHITAILHNMGKETE